MTWTPRRFGAVVLGAFMVTTLLLASCAGCDAPRLELRTDAAQALHVVAPARWAGIETTTTTAAPPRVQATSHTAPARAARDRPAPNSALAAPAGLGSVNGYPCGGDLPPCRVLRRESGGNPTAYNAGGCGGYGCGGLWQFDPRTWVNCWCAGWQGMTYKGYSRAELAPASVQNDRARELWAGGAGCRHWSACG